MKKKQTGEVTWGLFSEWLRQRIAERKWTLQETADQLKATAESMGMEGKGTSISTVWYITKGTGIDRIQDHHVTLLAKLFNEDVHYLRNLAGLPPLAPPTMRSAGTEGLAQRLDQLPPSLREQIVAAVNSILDATEPLLHFNAELALIKRHDPALAEAIEAHAHDATLRGTASDSESSPAPRVKAG